MAAIISLPVKMLVAQTLTSGWGCRCEANTNVPGAPRILDPPLNVDPGVIQRSKIQEENCMAVRYAQLTKDDELF